MEIPSEFLAAAIVAMAAYYIVQLKSPETIEKILSGLEGTRRRSARPGMTLKGIPITHIEDVGAKTRVDMFGTQKETVNLNLYDMEGNPYNIDEDCLVVPANALWHHNTGPIDLQIREDELTRAKQRIAYLETQVMGYQSEAAYVWKNRMDLSTINAQILGVMRKEIGSTQIIAGKNAAQQAGRMEAVENE